MSLLMDALKRAEHAKHGAQPEPPPPAAAPAAQPRADDASLSLAELSLAPVETGAPEAAVARDIVREPDAEEHLPPAAAPAQTLPAASTPVPAHPAHVEPADVVRAHGTPADAARILAASIAQRAAQRRRAIIGGIGLAGILAVAVGSYYYYAALTQQNPYLGLPQPPQWNPSATAAVDSGDAAPVESAPAESISDGSDTDTAAGTAPPTAAAPAQTPWREGPPPAAAGITDDWEPAPVDVRVLRGERPLPAAETADAAAPPVAAITITRSRQPDRVGIDLQTAYADFQAGRLTDAERVYRQVLARDAGNRDAHLGLAAIAARTGQPDTARAHYRTILQRNPKDASAQAALTDLGQDRPADSESRLKLLLTEQPDSAPLHFALANLYAGQQRWAYAQQAYFEALRLAPEQPDYAFNLAVSLEHLGQPRLALEQYRRALTFAAQGNAQFDLATAQQRVAALGAREQP